MPEPLPGPAVPGVGALPDRLKEHLLAAVGPLLPAERPWVLVDYPMHFNCGDGAIWLGELEIAGHQRAPVTRVFDRASFSPSRVPDGSTVLIQGGGNWGGLYRTHHALRVRVLRELRGHPVVQLPQSIEYADEAARDELRRAVADHPRVTLLVRDERSLEIARRDYDCPVHLVPDAAFALGTLARLPAQRDVVTQARTDKESPGDAPATTFDWLVPDATSRSRAWFEIARKLNSLQRRSSTDVVAHAARSAARRLAVANLDRAVDLLSEGRVVMTDRLHGHVLCTLLRIPHVVVNDRFGKIEALYSTWTHADPLSRLSPSWSQATAAMAELSETA